ncbi:XRE family transcriptional regulator [Actinomadura barringtoniae]|uniref:XRE family transcriptional regulator n=1 Tax=Actinomadura barringtoniae TaxID=1427535 RepID=A0A939PGA7_9ACTN|nr:XRE family transcriptional regulator [Actinomadura barringtoniae]
MSLAQLGEQLGVSRAQVWQWQDGRSVPTPHNLVELARVLEVDPYELFDADPQAPSLHDLRVRQGLSAKDLAEKAGLSYEGLVHRLDLGRGPAEVPEEVLGKLAEVLKVDVKAVRDACLRSRERRPT